ncbi:unnamed protein product [Ilex paraguariensis]|uniref:J domain-containing protein n=1 Tax=Ilex paraguariensis TaxID=185542 RepID=A0ABC8SBD8_9AQUA
MENLSHSLSRTTSYTSNGHFSASKTMYDDVFGGPPKYGVHTLSPRVEDYTEIFGGFSSSRASSIPILDLPGVDDSDLLFDVRSSKFDYSEVFGGFSGLDFVASCEELFTHSNGGVDSSDEAWSPAQSEYLSDESDPSAWSGKNQGLTNGDSHQSFDGTKQFNMSYNRANQTSKEDMLNRTINVTELNAIPGFTVVVNDAPLLQKIDDKNPPLQVEPDLNLSKGLGGGVIEGKRLRKTKSHPQNIVSGTQTYGSDLNPLAGYERTGSCRDETFITVCDISLKTRPTQLPPPSRPPPALAVKNEDSDRPKLRLKTSKSYAFERIAGDSSPPFFDVEVDASASAAASAAAMKDAMEKAQAKLRSAKELKERKKEGVQKPTKRCSENDIKDKARKGSEKFDGFNSFKDERVQGTHERKMSGMQIFAGEDSQEVLKTSHGVSSSIEGDKHLNSAQKSAGRKHAKHFSSSQGSCKTEDFDAWKEQFYEVVETDHSSMTSDLVKGEKTLVQNTKQKMMSHAYREEKKAVMEKFEQQEVNREIKAARQAHEWEKNMKQLTGAKGDCEWEENKGRSVAAKQLNRQEERHEKVKVAERVHEWKENDKKLRVSEQWGETVSILSETGKCEEYENLIEDQQKEMEPGVEQKLIGAAGKIENEKRIEDSHESKENGIRSKESFEREDYESILEKAVVRAENEKRMKETIEQEEEEEEEQQREVREREDIEKKQKECCERQENENRMEETLEREESDKRSNLDFEQEENKKEQKLAQQREQKENGITKACQQKENEMALNKTVERDESTLIRKEPHGKEAEAKRPSDACEREEDDKRLIEAWVQELQEAHEREDSEKRLEVTFKKEGTEKRSNEDSECIRVAGDWEGLKGRDNGHEQNGRVENERNLNSNQEIHLHVEAFDGVCNLHDSETPQATEVVSKHEKNRGKLETSQAALACEEDVKLRIGPKDGKNELEVAAEVFVEESFSSYGMHQDSLQQEGNQLRMENGSVTKLNEPGIGIGQRQVESENINSGMVSDPENANIHTHELGETGNNINGVQFAFDLDGSNYKFTSFQIVGEWIETVSKMGDARLGSEEKTQSTAQNIPRQSTEQKERNLNETIAYEGEKEERLKRKGELENDRVRKMEEEREREREREKDRMDVDKVTREARERAFAAVERATSEVRPSAIADARERLEKASAEARERSLAEKASMEARLRAERAAVERATAEARERAFEKVRAEKAAFEAQERVERSVADKFSASSRNAGMKESSSSAERQFQSMGSSNGLGYSYSSIQGGVEGESAQRCKARLERHQRTAERAAKALAEKNMRDHLAQREQAERNRLAETLDAEVKRWSSGKERNLRALLSTLQYILGPDSGWQPIPLTEVITSVAVKKAYRKAALCVHPDKLQQRGASIQQKYICEKVFDLLKEAWNKFNSEER